MSKVSNNFILQEFIYPKLYDDWGGQAIMWVSRRRIQTAQLFRDKVGKEIIINTWHSQSLKEKWGEFTYSGLRPLNCKIGASLSQHKYDSADDIKCEGMSGWDLHQVVLDNWDEFRSLGVTTLEHHDFTPTWIHIDGRNVQGLWNLDHGPMIVSP